MAFQAAQRPPARLIDINALAYGAKGDNTADDSVAIQAAINVAAAKKLRLYIPNTGNKYKLTQQGTVFGGDYCVKIPKGAHHLTIVSDGAQFKWPSTTTHAFVVDTDVSTGAQHLHVDGLSFEGDTTDNSYLTNNKFAFYLVRNCPFAQFTSCTFSWCSPVQFGTDGDQTGLATVAFCNFLNCTNSISSPYRSSFTGCKFANDALLLTRSHGIYIFGPAGGCTISGCTFRNIDKEAIQIRAGTGRYNQKTGFAITGNYFEFCGWGVWVGSDDSTEVGQANVVGNVFKDCGVCITGQGCRNALFANNTCYWTWEFGDTAIGISAISVASGGVSLPNHQSQADGVRVEGNILTIRHPFFRKLTLNTQPTAGQTITVGAPPNSGKVYTWVTGYTSTPGQVSIGASLAQSAENLVAEIKGAGFTFMNKVLREQHDCFSSRYDYGSNTNEIVIVSHSVFACSSTMGGALTIGAMTDNRFPNIPISAVNCFYPTISNNTVTDFTGGLLAECCVSPLIESNHMLGTFIRVRGCSRPRLRGNRPVRTQVKHVNQPRPYRWAYVGESVFPVLQDNGLVVQQEGQCQELGGAAGIVPVGNGKAQMIFGYGIETTTSFLDESQGLCFSYAEGDEVYIDDGSTLKFQAVFKRTSPNAGASPPEFNSADGLVALINAGSTYDAAYVPYLNVGSTPNPKVNIRISLRVAGTAGNSHRFYFTRYTTADRMYSRTIGQILLNESNDETYMRFMGGAATATKTVVFSELASTATLPRVVGVDSTSQALAPTVYISDVIPEVGFVITHGVAAGTEKFAFTVATP